MQKLVVANTICLKKFDVSRVVCSVLVLALLGSTSLTNAQSSDPHQYDGYSSQYITISNPNTTTTNPSHSLDDNELHTGTYAFSYLEPGSFLGDVWDGIWNRTRRRSIQFTLHPLKPNQKKGDINFYSNQLGHCSNTPNTGATAEYGYTVLPSDPLTKIGKTGLNEVQQLYSVIFCKSGYYILVVEWPMDTLSDSPSRSEAGLYIQDRNLKVILSTMGTLTKKSEIQ